MSVRRGGTFCPWWGSETEGGASNRGVGNGCLAKGANYINRLAGAYAERYRRKSPESVRSWGAVVWHGLWKLGERRTLKILRGITMDGTLKRSALGMVVGGVAVAPLPVLAASTFDGGISLSGRDILVCFLLLLILNTCSLLTIGAMRAWVAPLLLSNGRHRHRAVPRNPQSEFHSGGLAAPIVDEVDRLSLWGAAYEGDIGAEPGRARVRIPIDADSFQSWQSIARDGILKTRK